MSPPPPARLTWLHLSDFHLRVKTGWSQDQVLNSLLEDIRTRYSNDQGPDLLFLTGDISFSGKEEEYALAEDFIRKLCAATKLKADRVCLVPGNHDIDLDKEEDAVVGARTSLVNGDLVDRFFGNEGRRRTLFARQKAFRDFANRLSPCSPSIYTDCSHAHSRMLEVGQLRVRVLLLDSAWLAGGGPKDAGELLVGERQVLDCGPLDDGSLTFALLHHPLSWLREFEQVSIENLIMRSAQICLRGHVHAVDTRRTEGRLGSLSTFTAGAAFQSRTADNSYLWCSIDLTTGRGEKVVHRYIHAQHCWEASQKEAWTLVPSTLRAPDVTAVHRHLAGVNTAYPSYVACLVCSLQTEVPIELAGRKCVFVGCDATLPGVPNRCGEAIQKLRNHFYWERVWKSDSWVEHLRHLSHELGAAFHQLDAMLGEDLQSREIACIDLIRAVDGGAEGMSPVCEEIGSLLETNELERAREVVDRWIGQDLFRPNEALQFQRMEIFLLLAEGRPNDALERVDALVMSAERTSHDLVLAAKIAHDAQEYTRATGFMHTALDLGLPVNEVRAMALKIAGNAGDKTLTDRVMR